MTQFPRQRARSWRYQITCAYLLMLLGTVPQSLLSQSLDDVLKIAEPKPACEHADTGFKCHGHGTAQWTNVGSPAGALAVGQSLDAMTFRGNSTQVERASTHFFTIRHTMDSDRYWVKNLSSPIAGRRVQVVARITVDDSSPSAPKDVPYDIGGRPDKNMSGQYFIVVVGGYVPDPVNVVKHSYKVATWQIYGLEKVTVNGVERRYARRLNATGKFRICMHQHQGEAKKYGATFMECDDSRRITEFLHRDNGVRQALGDQSVVRVLGAFIQAAGAGAGARAAAEPRAVTQPMRVTAQQINAGVNAFVTELRRRGAQVTEADALMLRTAVQNQREAPAWMPCGLGCCTADDNT